MRLNLACGENRIEGWENHDLDVDLFSLPLPWPDESADFILLEHFLEHCTGPEALRLLDDLRRILKVGGVLRVCVPTLEKLDRAKARDIILNHGHQVPYSHPTLVNMLYAAGFETINMKCDCARAECDGHWRIIGKEQDDWETYRVEATR